MTTPENLDYEGPPRPPERVFDLDSGTGQIVEVDGSEVRERESPPPPERKRELRAERRARADADLPASPPTTLTTRRSTSAKERLRRMEGRVRDTESALETAKANHVECRKAVSDSFGSEFSFANIEAAEAAELAADAEVKRLTDRLELLRQHAEGARAALAARQAGDSTDKDLAALTTECWESLQHVRETAQALLAARERLLAARQKVHPVIGRKHAFIQELAYPLATLDKVSRLLQAYLESPLSKPGRLLP